MSSVGSQSWSPEAEPPGPVRRFSLAEYHGMVAAGIFPENDDYEFLEGWLVPKMVHGPRHDTAVDLAHNSLRVVMPPGWRLRIQSAIETQDGEPEPDIVAVRGEARKFS